MGQAVGTATPYQKPTWARYEGTIITAVKLAEELVPDGTPNKGLARLDKALAYVLRVYEHTTGKPADEKTEAELKEGIQLAHDKLEANGTL